MWEESAAVSLDFITPVNLVSLMKSQQNVSHKREDTGFNNTVLLCLLLFSLQPLSLPHKNSERETIWYIQRFLLKSIAYTSFFALGCFSVLAHFCTEWKKCEKLTNQFDWVSNVETSQPYQMDDTVWFPTDWLIPSLFLRQPHLSCDRLTEAEHWPMSTAQTWDRKWFIIHVERD